MDWRDLLDERRRRAQQNNTWSSSRFAATPSSAPEEDDGGFFGGWDPLKAAGDAVGAVGGFFGNMVSDVVDKGVSAVTGIGDVVGGALQAGKGADIQKRRDELAKDTAAKVAAAMGADADNPDSAKWDSPEVKAIVEAGEKRRKEFEASVKGDEKSIREAREKANKVDTTKTAASAAETFLNVATLGVGGIAKNAGKQAIKQGAKVFGEKTAEKVANKIAQGNADSLAAGLAKKEAADAAAQTAGGALRRVGGTAAEGAALGGSAGFLDPFSREGENADIADAWSGALMGSAFGAGLGGGASLLDKNVRAGLRQIPAEYRALPRSVREGGYVNLPFSQADEAADLAARQLNGEDISRSVDPTAAEYINETAAEYSSPQEFVDALTNRLWQENKKGKGVDSWLTKENPNDIHFNGRAAASNNTPFYQAYYAAHGSKPSKKGIRDIVEQELGIKPKEQGEYTNVLDTSPSGSEPYARDIYQQLLDREGSLQRTMEQGPPAGAFDQFAQDLGQTPGSTSKIPNSSNTPDIPEGSPQRPGEAPAPQTVTSPYDSPQALQTALARGEAEANPQLDYVNPMDIPSRQPTTGAQQPIDLPTTNPYEGMPQNLDTLALPQGELPKAPTVAAAKREFKATGEAPEFVNQQRPGTKPINLPADSTDLAQAATKTTEAGNVTPIKNGADYVAKDIYDGIKDLQTQSDRFRKISPLTDINSINEAITKYLGGVQSKAGQIFENIRAKVQSADARVVQYQNEIRKLANADFEKYGFTPEQWNGINRWLNQQSDNTVRSQEFAKLRQEFGDDVAARAQEMFDTWSPRMRQSMEQYNALVTKLGYPERAIGDLGELYWPRVYAPKGFKEKATDVAASIIDLKANGLDKTGYNPNTMSGSTTVSNMALPGDSRMFNQAPIGSEYSKPTVGYSGHAQARTAKSPVGPQVNPLEAAAKYLESVNAIRFNAEAVHDIRGVQAAIKAIQKETGDNSITILNDVLDNVANPLLGKTNEIDRSFAKYEAGQKAMEWGGFLSKQLSRSQLLGSVRTVLAQTGQIPLLASEVGSVNAAKGIRAMFSKEFADLMAQSDFLISNKFMGNEAPFSASTMKRLAQKGERGAGWAMEAAAASMAKSAWAGGYLKALEGGFTGKAAIREADRLAAKIVGNRAAGLRPALYESRIAQGLAMYTLDINQMYQATKGYIGDKNYKALGTLLGAAFAYNAVYKALVGEGLTADPVDAAVDAADILTNQDYDIGFGERLARAGGRMGGEALAFSPLGNLAGGIYPEEGIRMPFSGDRLLSRAELFGDSQIGRYGPSAPLAAAFENPLYLTGIPGLSQAQRSLQGIESYNQGASISPSGNVRFAVDQNPENWWRSMLFGQYNTAEGRDYIRQLSRNQQGL